MNRNIRCWDFWGINYISLNGIYWSDSNIWDFAHLKLGIPIPALGFAVGKAGPVIFGNFIELVT